VDPRASFAQISGHAEWRELWTISFSHLLDGGIEKGYVGNRHSVFVKIGLPSFPDFSRGNNGHTISYQEFGQAEPFLGGKLAVSHVIQRPCWVKSGEALYDICTQLEIVDALTGCDPELPEDTLHRRRENYRSFFKEVDNDGSYRKNDVL